MSAELLFVRYQPLAQQIARGFARKLPQSVLIEDLEAAASLGLWDAAKRDAAHEHFEWYARTRIRGAVIDELRRQDWLPRRARARDPELKVLYLEQFENLDWVSSLSLAPDAEQALERKERSAILQARISALPPREASVLRDVMEGISHKQIALSLGVSEPRISQLRERAEQRILGQIPPLRRRGRPPKQRAPAAPQAAHPPRALPAPRSTARPKPTPILIPKPPLPAPSPPRVVAAPKTIQRSLWASLMAGTLRCLESPPGSNDFELRLGPCAGEPDPAPFRDAWVLKHWLLCGRPSETAAHFELSRTSIGMILGATLKTFGIAKCSSQVPLGLVIAARADEPGIDLELVPCGDGSSILRIERKEAWLARLSVVEKEILLGLLGGESREALARSRGTTYRTVSNQLWGAFRKLKVSTVSELRALYARIYVEELASALGFSGLVA
jgi:RNA polymerase sigma factor (sigma-70 family)